MELIPDYAYQWVYLIILTILCSKHTAYLSGYPSFESLKSRPDTGYKDAVWLLIATCLFFGLRPISERFTDMLIYAEGYESGIYITSTIRYEPIWTIIQLICNKYLGLSTSLWFLVVGTIAFVLKFKACRSICGPHIYTVFLFLLTSFSCWSNGTGIIRSHIGMALAMCGIAIWLREDSKKQKFYALLLFITAYYTHKSSILLVGAFLASWFFIKNIKSALFFYILCILLSLALGNYFEVLFSSIGFDDRMAQITTNVDYTGFAHAGFRWDFLIYSIVPIILGWYITNRLKVEDKIYSYLLNTYMLSNAFWVLVIRAQFSDRIASISWTLYFLVLAYPLLKMKLFNNQPKMVGRVLWFQMGFLWFMQLYYAVLR